jgi:hypothetical protein
MSIYKNWQDFDKTRNKSGILVIYGAGTNGRIFFEHYKIIPDYFCDKKANKIKSITHTHTIVKCLTLKKLLIELDGRDADILVSNLNENVIKNLHNVFDRTKFTKNTVIYFHHDYDIINRKFASKFSVNYKINNIIKVKTIDSILAYDFDFVKENFNIQTLLETAYFEGDFQSVIEFEKFMKSRLNRKAVFQNNKVNFLNLNIQEKKRKEKKRKEIIYFFGNSVFLNISFKTERGIDFILSSLLGKNNYKIENNSCPGFYDKSIIFQLTSTPLVKNSIVIITGINDPYLLSVAKQYCKKYNCRLIFYKIPPIIFKNNLTSYEEWLIKISGTSQNFRLYEEQNLKKIKSIAKAMCIEFYEPPKEFFNSNKTIYLDNIHFSPYGSEIIAKHLYDIVTRKIKSYNSSTDFCIYSEEKIEYANAIIPIIVPEIQIYLMSLEKYKQNSENCGAIVMNCNPFTFGHKYLIEYAATKVESLYIFVVEEDKSEFPFKDRHKLIKQNTKNLKNVIILPSGKFIISSTTFASYFNKSEISEKQATEQDVSFDLLIFAAAIAPVLNIKKRFVGNEPFDHVTRHYNEEMKKILTEYGCQVIEIPRLKKNNVVVSASRVRKLLNERNFEEIKKIVPITTLKYLKKKQQQ